MKSPLLLVNFKTYESSTAKNAVRLAKIHEKVARKTGVNIAVAVSAFDLAMVAQAVKIPVFAQHVDPYDYGAHTGHLTPMLAKKYGATGTLINHSEHRMEKSIISKTVMLAKKINLFTVVCTATPKEAAIMKKMQPNMIAVEPPELIGGDISVFKAKPEVIVKSVKLVGKNHLLIGAGVKTADDITVALELGASGILVASGITLAKDPEKVLLSFAKAMKM